MITVLADTPDYEQWREGAKRYVAFLKDKNYVRCSWDLEYVIEELDYLMEQRND